MLGPDSWVYGVTGHELNPAGVLNATFRLAEGDSYFFYLVDLDLRETPRKELHKNIMRSQY